MHDLLLLSTPTDVVTLGFDFFSLNSLLIIRFAIVLRPLLLFQCPEWFSSYFHRLLLTAVSIFQIGICNIHRMEVISQTSSLLKTQNFKWKSQFSLEDKFLFGKEKFARNWLIFASLLDLICFASHQSSVSELFFQSLHNYLIVVQRIQLTKERGMCCLCFFAQSNN